MSGGVSFGVGFAPQPPASRSVEVKQPAEANGLEYARLLDSPGLVAGHVSPIRARGIASRGNHVVVSARQPRAAEVR